MEKECGYKEAVLSYKYLLNDSLFGQNLNMWRNQSLKTVLEYEYYRLICYIRTLNELSISDRTAFSSKLDQLRCYHYHLTPLTVST